MTNEKDLRNDLAKARDDFMEHAETKGMLIVHTLGPTSYYLRNRIESAFIAGWNARNKQP